MGKFTLTHEIGGDQDAFWSAFFDSSITEKLYLETLAVKAFNILEKSETDTQILRKLYIQPQMDVPTPVAKLRGQNYSIVEEGVFDKSTKIWRWKQIPSTRSDTIRTEGTIRIEPIVDGKVRRILEVTLEAKVYGVGGLIESSSEKAFREEADRTAIYFSNILK